MGYHLHCIAPSPELGVLDFLKGNKDLKAIQDVLHLVHKHYCFLPKALRELRMVGEAMEVNVVKPTRLGGTRRTPMYAMP